MDLKSVFGTRRKKLALAGFFAFLLIVGVGLMLRRTWDPEYRRARQAIELEEQLRGKNSSDSGKEGLRALSVANLSRFIESSDTATPKIMMAQYLLYYRYPQSSRPLSRVMEDLVDPFRVSEQRIPMFMNNPIQEGEKPVYTYAWSGKSWLVTENNPATFVLTVFDPETDRPVKVSVLSSNILADDVFGHGVVGSAESAEDSDSRTIYKWKPEPGRRNHWGELALVSKIKTPNGKTFDVAMPFSASPNPPAVFTGQYREDLADGSLEIGVGVNIQKEGKYIFEANLYDDSGKPLHWVFVDKYMEKGVQFVNLKFFGLIFHDQDFDSGKLVLRNLRGHRMPLPYDPRKLDAMLASGVPIPTNNEPFQEWMTPVDAPYKTTRSFNVSEFSRKEYEGQDKEQRLTHVRQYARDWESAHGASTDTAID